MNRDDDQEEPRFASLEEMARWAGWNDEQTAKVRVDMLLTGIIADTRDAANVKD